MICERCKLTTDVDELTRNGSVCCTCWAAAANEMGITPTVVDQLTADALNWRPQELATERSFRCSRGHEWKVTEYPLGVWVSINPNEPQRDLVVDGKRYCMACLREFLDKNIGTVE